MGGSHLNSSQEGEPLYLAGVNPESELADRDAQSVEFNASLEEKDNSTAASVGSTYHEKDHDGGSFSFSFSLFLSTLAFTSTDSFLSY